MVIKKKGEENVFHAYYFNNVAAFERKMKCVVHRKFDTFRPSYENNILNVSLNGYISRKCFIMIHHLANLLKRSKDVIHKFNITFIYPILGQIHSNCEAARIFTKKY